MFNKLTLNYVFYFKIDCWAIVSVHLLIRRLVLRLFVCLFFVSGNKVAEVLVALPRLKKQNTLFS